MVQNQHQHRYLRLGSKILKIKRAVARETPEIKELPQIAQVRLRNLVGNRSALQPFRNWGRNWLGNRHGTGSLRQWLWHRHSSGPEVALAPAQVLVQRRNLRERVPEMVIQQVRDQAV